MRAANDPAISAHVVRRPTAPPHEVVLVAKTALAEMAIVPSCWVSLADRGLI